MTSKQLIDIISNGETSKVQFNREIRSNDAIAVEMIAFANSKGGTIIIGIEDKTGAVTGLSSAQLREYNQMLANIGNDLVKPPVFITTEVVHIEEEDKKVLLVDIDEGTAKPYKDRNGTIWLKQGADKRRLTDNHEQARLFQQSGIVYFDEMIVPQTSIADIDLQKVEQYIQALRRQDVDEQVEITDQLLQNLNILRNGQLSLGGLLFFAKNPQRYRPALCVKAVSFFGNSIGGTAYRSSRDMVGTIPQLFEESISFFTSNLQHIQAGQNFNSVGMLEVSQTALEELLQNALVHRDYSINAPIRLMIFDNRIEIVSPGCLPNSLTVENIKLGNAVVRNNLIVSYCSKLMLYRGFGSGIARALMVQPNIELINDVEGEQFKVIIPRPERN